jgi:arylsulfatase B
LYIFSKSKKAGTILKQSYSGHRCTPSRASLLTGRYAFRFGLGADAISKENPVGMDLTEKLLPEYLKEIGYETHLVGKWHLGYCNSSFQPHNRGFDTFYGHYGGSLDYFNHTKVRYAA